MAATAMKGTSAAPASCSPGDQALGFRVVDGWRLFSFGTQSRCAWALNAAKKSTATFSYTRCRPWFAGDYVQKAYVAYFGGPADQVGQAYWQAASMWKVK